MITLNVALIGYGYWGPKLARNIQNSNNFQIRYIIDNSKKNLEKAKNDFPLAKFYKNYKSLPKENIDLVVISTPTKTHFQMANYFLNFSHVLIEKPLSINLKDVVNLEKKSTKMKKKLFVDYPFIFSGSIKYIKNVIKQKIRQVIRN